jgi:hypothetical protein
MADGLPSNFTWQIFFGMADMRARSLGLAFAAILLFGRTVPGHAEDAASKSATTPTAAQTPAPTGAQTGAPASVPRPSIAPKTAEPAPAAEEGRHRRTARHQYRRYAYWEPFPIYWPHYSRHRTHWSRVSWFGF